MLERLLSGRKYWLLLSVVYGLFLSLRLDSLPIFADEAIYIRWAQLILDDPQRYAFFALNDGKTPLFIWLLSGFQLLVGPLFANQLLAARFVAVLVGMAQVLVARAVVVRLRGSLFMQHWAFVSFGLLPFWFFNHRMALMDGALAVLIGCMVWAALVLFEQRPLASLRSRLRPYLRAILQLAAFVCLALLTKLPAILVMPALFVLLLLDFTGPASVSSRTRSFYSWLQSVLPRLMALSAAIVLGGGLFALLALHPAFPQLFARGSDFLYSPGAVVFDGVWRTTLQNIPSYLEYFVQYMGLGFVLVLLAGLFKHPRQRQVHVFFWAGVVVALPMVILGQVVYSRYFLPAVWFFSMAGVFSFGGYVEKINQIFDQSLNRNAYGWALVFLIVFGMVQTVSHSTLFASVLVLDPDNTPFVSSDTKQHLTEWSSGHGITQVIDQLRAQQEVGTSVALATEGYFGTLPDALLVYLHRTNLEGIYVEGIGQPVRSIPKSFWERADQFDQVWLVGNEYRLQLDFSDARLVGEYCRPFQATCLQLWDITNMR